jgi:hypothetical protein
MMKILSKTLLTRPLISCPRKFSSEDGEKEKFSREIVWEKKIQFFSLIRPDVDFVSIQHAVSSEFFFVA